MKCSEENNQRALNDLNSREQQPPSPDLSLESLLNTLRLKIYRIDLFGGRILFQNKDRALTTSASSCPKDKKESSETTPLQKDRRTLSQLDFHLLELDELGAKSTSLDSSRAASGRIGKKERKLKSRIGTQVNRIRLKSRRIFRMNLMNSHILGLLQNQESRRRMENQPEIC